MTFEVDTGWTQPEIMATTAGVDDTQQVIITTHKRAQPLFNKIKANIEAHECPDALDAYMERETMTLDALHLFDPFVSEELNETYETHRACLVHGGAARQTQSGNQDAQTPNNGNTAKKGKTMFDIDTGPQGSQGPWIAWSARGTLDGTIEPKSFFIRDENGKTATDAFTKGVVMDIYAMKTGWQKSDGIAGQAPDWKWNPSVSQMMQQPGEDYKKGFSINCAIGGGNTATWEQAGAAAWNAFTNLVPELQQAPEGKLPVVKITGTKLQQFKRGSTVEPILEVIKWVDRPDCLKEGVQAGVDTGAATSQPAPAPQPQTAAPADADMEF